MTAVWPAVVVATAALISATAAATVSINIGSTSGAPGVAVTFQVTLASGGAQVGGVQNVIAFDPATPISACAISPPLAALSRWSLQPQGCTPLVNCTQANFVILTFGSVIPDGLLYQCDVKIAADAPGGIYPLPCSGVRASDPTGQVLAVQCADGQVEVVRPTPEPVASATPTPIVAPTATTTPSTNACSGDCDGNHLVTVDEILKMVGVALGSAPVVACEPGDGNRDGQITVDEIVAAVSAALTACGPG